MSINEDFNALNAVIFEHECIREATAWVLAGFAETCSSGMLGAESAQSSG